MKKNKVLLLELIILIEEKLTYLFYSFKKYVTVHLYDRNPIR